MKLHENPKRWNNKDKQRFLSKFLNQSLPKREKMNKIRANRYCHKFISAPPRLLTCLVFVNLNVQFFPSYISMSSLDRLSCL